MNTHRPSDEFEAARMVADVLKGLAPEEQARAIRWAQEKLRGGGSSSRSPGDEASGGHELSTVLSDPMFLRHQTAVDKMLHLLSAAYKLRSGEFQKLLVIGGRMRRYFATSEAEIARSGNSTQPRRIPDTEFWLMTNSPTPQKQELLQRALRLLGFSNEAVKDAVATII